MELVGDDAIEAFKNLVGPDDPIEARGKAPNSLRALFGEDTVHNGVYCPFNRSSIERVSNSDFFFVTSKKLKILGNRILLPNRSQSKTIEDNSNVTEMYSLYCKTTRDQRWKTWRYYFYDL